MEKNCVILAIPRSGSTPVEKTVACYLSQHFGHTDLNEFFNPRLNVFPQDDAPPRIAWDDSTEKLSMVGFPSYEVLCQERLELLSTLKKPVLIKVFPLMPSTAICDTLFKNSTVINVERKNLFENLLSFGISMMTKKFYEKGGIHLPDKSLALPSSEFLKFLMLNRLQKDFLKNYPHVKTILFEDFMEKPPEDYMPQFGFERPTDWSRRKLPEKQNKGDKLSIFTNADEIIHWYKNSFLQKKFPIDESGVALV